MAEITNPILKQYAILTDFLGKALGPYVEIALHDLTDPARPIIAIANGEVSGREVGAPMTNAILSVLHSGSYETADYQLHDFGLAPNGKELRSNTLFIKEEGRLIGMLCVNFDDSHYRSLANQVMGLAHPDAYIQEMVRLMGGRGMAAPLSHPLSERSNQAVVAEVVGRELEELGATAKKLTAQDRLRIIAALEADGVFLRKGIVADAAAALGCSQASVYRYLAQVRSEQGKG